MGVFAGVIEDAMNSNGKNDGWTELPALALGSALGYGVQ